ncbi:MAG TPA: nucleotide sugar dehydrogenase [candidate division Zixibacteria bacterium]|nr:nucleotide sugar dehydrogenase [candidate division Zixibacteria bacterium]
MTTVSVFGLGYVGSVSAGCLADRGLDVIGVDVTPIKVDTINAGRSPIVEHGLDHLIRRGVEAGRLRATADAVAAVRASDASLICVGTPSNANGSLDLSAVQRVIETIGRALREHDRPHVVIVRSTMLPGSTETLLVPILERAAGRQLGDGLSICYNPEFLREGSSLRDFDNPPYTIIGGSDSAAIELARSLYAGIAAPLHVVPIRVAEMLKYASNAFHALKVAFANEIGVLCKALGVDSGQLMDIFCADTKLNISSAYLRPGFAFGGSCLPKDLRAVLHRARSQDLELPVLEAVLPSNRVHVERAYEMIRATGLRRIGLLGLSFKAGTDDLRESPLVSLVERLIGRGYDVRIFDRDVSLANLHGTNRSFIEREIPHLVRILTDDIDAVLDHAEVVVIGNGSHEHREALGRLREDQRVIDLVRIPERESIDPERYEGVAW